MLISKQTFSSLHSIWFGVFFVLMVFSANSQLLNYDVKIEFDKNQIKQIIHQEILIEKKNDLRFAEISLYQSGLTKISHIEAKIKHKGKVVRELKSKDLKERSAVDFSGGELYNDDVLIEFEMVWNEFPYIIELDYHSKSNRFIEIARWYPIANKYFRSSNKSSLEITVHEDIALNVYYSDELNYSRESKNGHKHHFWDIENYKLPKNQKFAPEFDEFAPYVFVSADEINYSEKGSFKYWDDYGEWMYKLYHGQNELPDSDKSKVQQLIEAKKSTEEMVKVLYHYLQDETRYVNVNIKYGGNKPYPASYVSENKYGDCKALSVYMSGLLKEAGVDYHYALIEAGDQRVSYDTTKMVDFFNHIILCVPTNADTFWLENTSTELPFNYLGTFTQDRPVLLFSEDHVSWSKTPALSSEQVSEQYRYDVFIDNQVKSNLRIHTKWRGELFEKYRFLLKNYSAEEVEEYLLKDLKIRKDQLEDWRFTPFERDHDDISFEMDVSDFSYKRQIGQYEDLKIWQANVPDFESPDHRTLDVIIPYPISICDSVVYHFNNGSIPELMKADSSYLNSPYGIYYCKSAIRDHRIVFNDQLIINKGKIPLENYLDFYEFIEQIKHIQNQHNLIIKK